MQDLFSCSMQTLNCSMWDLVPWPGIKPRLPALGAQTLSHWSTRDVPTPASLLTLPFLPPSVSRALHSPSLLVLSWSPFLSYWAGPHGWIPKTLPQHHPPFASTPTLHPHTPNKTTNGKQHNATFSALNSWTANLSLPSPSPLLDLACFILGRKLVTPALAVCSFNHWTTREVPQIFFFLALCLIPSSYCSVSFLLLLI